MLQSRLYSIMRNELETQNLEFSLYCVQRIEKLVDQGFQRMKMSNAVDDKGYVMRAEGNLKSLIKYFAEYSQDVGTFPRLSNSDFDSALNACPSHWPFHLTL